MGRFGSREAQSIVGDLELSTDDKIAQIQARKTELKELRTALERLLTKVKGAESL